MFIIKSMEVIETERDYFELRPDMNLAGLLVHPAKPEEYDLTFEVISGRRFRHPDGREIVIGWSNQVQEVLEFPFEAFDTAERENEYLRVSRDALLKTAKERLDEINTLSSLSLWGHIVHWWNWD